jgi:hypothetical protein
LSMLLGSELRGVEYTVHKPVIFSWLIGSKN